ncbi:MAG: hypothetical protein WEF50_22245 [Myxococcota bacterium]
MGNSGHSKAPRQAPGARFGAHFWDAVEVEIEALDVDDFALFLAADRLPCAAAPGRFEALGDALSGLCRARFSN